MEHCLVIGLGLTGLMLFSYWIIYCLGSPLARDRQHVDPTAIGFFVPHWLAYRRVRLHNVAGTLEDQHLIEYNVTTDPVQRQRMRREMKLDVLESGREFFTWERSLLCPVCLHWWITLLAVALFVVFNWLNLRDHLWWAAFAYLSNHLFLRKIL